MQVERFGEPRGSSKKRKKRLQTPGGVITIRSTLENERRERIKPVEDEGGKSHHREREKLWEEKPISTIEEKRLISLPGGNERQGGEGRISETLSGPDRTREQS